MQRAVAPAGPAGVGGTVGGLCVGEAGTGVEVGATGFGVSVAFGALVAVGTGVAAGFAVAVSDAAEWLDAALGGDEPAAGALSPPQAEKTTVKMNPRYTDRFIEAGPQSRRENSTPMTDRCEGLSSKTTETVAYAPGHDSGSSVGVSSTPPPKPVADTDDGT